MKHIRLFEGFDNSISKILIIVAMADEAAPTVRSLGLQKQEGFKRFPFEVHRGEFEGKEIMLVTSGKDRRTNADNVGTQVASAMASVCIREFEPDLVMNIGTAGGFKSAGGEIGSVYTGTKLQYHDHRIPVPGFEDYAKGDYEAAIPEHVKDMYPAAIVSTGSSIDITDREREQLSKQAEKMPVVKEMEATAIAQVCSWSDVPLLVLKSITDLIDGGEPSHEEFVRNLKKASDALHDAAMAVLKKL